MRSLKNLEIEILKESSDWLVINKPSGLHSVKSARTNEASVEDWLLLHRTEQAKLREAGIVHRLDEPTSGCLLIAKTAEALERLQKAIRSEQIRKTYLAYAVGKAGSGNFELYFSSRYKRSQKVSVGPTGSDKERGRIEWKCLETRPGYSILRVALLGPGKKHQIRAGLAHLGHPLRGDILYGGPEWKESFGLHSSVLEWDENRIKCPAPFEWKFPEN